MTLRQGQAAAVTPRSVGVVAVVAASLACTTGAKPTSSPELAPASSASAAARPSASSSAGASPSAVAAPTASVARAPADGGAEAGPPARASEEDVAWTDPHVVEELAKDCAFTPRGVVRPKGVDRDYWGEVSPLSCEWGLYGQSCVVDPCVDEQKDVCAPKCQKACEGCAGACVSGCQSCKAACAKGDAACALACAKKCGACRQECVLAKDRCSSGACAKRALECRKETMARWVASGCDKACKAFYTCVEACPDDTAEKCRDACRTKTLGPCTPVFRAACIFNGMLYSPDELKGP